jgi:glycerophosphoryl diester phosphodiesterase
MNRLRFWPLVGLPFLALAGVIHSGEPGAKRPDPQIVGHRGLMHHSPENTVAGFSACITLRLGFELDVRRDMDGTLVCLHDDDVARTTNGKNKVTTFALAELRKLDAGAWFHPAFRGEKVPTLAEVFELLKLPGGADLLVALDIKAEDDAIEADLIGLAKKHGVLKQTVCIGRAIEDKKVRAKLRAADPKAPVAALAKTPDDVAAVLAGADADWVYVRFVPSAEMVKTIHARGTRVFLVGPLVAGNESANWRRGKEAGVDAILTDFPLECRESWRPSKVK